MDAYTAACREWLDRRFRMVDENGVYRPHQPVYGINTSEPRLMEVFNELCLAYTILLVLADLDDQIESLLDVGCAEGYTAHTIASLLFRGSKAFGLDLSHEALLRAQSLYQLPAIVGELRYLPFVSSAVDIVICSETIEHVVDPQQALIELDRIARKVLLITTPANWATAAQSMFAEADFGHLHEHINQFTQTDLRCLLGRDIEILGARSVLRGFNRLQQTLINKRWVTRTLLKVLVWMNYLLGQLLPHKTMHFVVVNTTGRASKRRRIDMRIATQLRLLQSLFEYNIVPKLKLAESQCR